MNPKVIEAIGIIGRFVADNWESMVDDLEIQDELINKGFSNRDITDAFHWIEYNTVGDSDEAREITGTHQGPCRPLNTTERSKLSSKAYGFLVSCYDRGILDAVIFEEIIERAMRSELEEIGEPEIRRLTSLTLFTRLQSEWQDFLHASNTLVH